MNRFSLKKWKIVTLVSMASIFINAGCSPKALEGMFNLSSTGIGFQQESITVPENATTNYQINIDLGVAAEAGASIDVSIAGTATASDHNLSSTTINLTPGSLQTSLNLSVVNDLFYEGNETIEITLLNPVNVELGSTTTLTIIIEDDENIEPLNLVTTVDGPTRVTLDWDPSSSGIEAGYRIAYLPGALAPIDCDSGTVIDEGSIAGTLHQVTGLTVSSLYSFRVCGIDGASPANRSFGVTATVTTSVPAVIYRSAGITATALDTGASGGMTISSSVATFAASLPNNVGVGDAIQYDCDEDDDGIGSLDANDCVIFITSRNDTLSQVYGVSGPDGSAVPDLVTPDVDWSIFRAYTSFANAESGTVNTNIDTDLQAQVTGGDRDLVANGEDWNIALYADGEDSTNVVIDGWTTASGLELKFFTPNDSSQVESSQRHRGETYFGGYLLNGGVGTTNTITINTNYVTIDGLIIDKVGGVGSESGVRSLGTPVTIKNNLILGINGGTENDGILITDTLNTSITAYVYNNAFWSNSRSALMVQGSTFDGVRIYFYNNTAIGVMGNNFDANMAAVGFDVSGTYVDSILYAKNNYIEPANGLAFQVGGGAIFDPSSTNNASSDATAPGANAILNVTNPGIIYRRTANYNLDSRTSILEGAGADLSSDPFISFTTDSKGHLRGRGNGWDIGFSEAPVPVYRSVGPGNTNALVDSAGNTNMLNLVGTTATFDLPLPDNVGIGDVLVYDQGGTTKYAFLSKKLDDLNYLAFDADGESGTGDISNDGSWEIYRAYTSLANGENGDENTGIPGTPNFDSWSGGQNLFPVNKTWNYIAYADAVDTTQVVFSGWNTTAANYISVSVPDSQQHGGQWNTNTYTLSGLQQMISITESVIIDGIQVELQAGGSAPWDQAMILANFTVFYDDAIVRNTIIRNRAAAGGNVGLQARYRTTSSRYYNNIIYGFAYGILTDNNTSNGWPGVAIFNNTVVNNSNGIYRGNNNNYRADRFYNNLALGNTTDINNAGPASYPRDCDGNASTDTTAQTFCTQGIASSVTGISPTDVFIDYANEDFRIKPGATILNAGADASLYDPEGLDILGRSRGVLGSWDIGAMESANAIYRSIGPGNTNSLADGVSGAGNDLIINGSVATFSAALADNIGVGDAIQFDSDNNASIDSVIFITARTDAQNYTVANADGTPVADMGTADREWEIYRAYTSLEAVDSTNENTGLDATIADFDSAALLDLASTNSQLNLVLYGDGAATAWRPNGYTTDTMNYLRLFSPNSDSEAGSSQRHGGFWDSGKARIVDSDATGLIFISTSESSTLSHFRVEGIQLDNTFPGVSPGQGSGFHTIDPNGPTDYQFINNIFRKTNVSTGTGIWFDGGGYWTVKIINNIIYDFNDGIHLNSSLINSPGADFFIYNNTIVNSASEGIVVRAYGSDTYLGLKNNLVQDSGADDYELESTVENPDYANNLSSDTTAFGTGAIVSADVAFYDEGNDDFRLEINDAVAKDAGVDLSADSVFAFTYDIAMNTRTGTWDIGASSAIPNPNLYTAYNDEGSGTMGDPYQIYTKEQLKDIGASGCNSGTTTACAAYFTIQDDIDLISEAFTPIGDCTNSYSGTFDGGGYTISNLSINLLATDCVGFIGRANDATISNVVLADVDVQGNDYVGSLIGLASGSTAVTSCTSSGLVDSDNSSVGGFVGRTSNSTTITLSSTSVDVGTRITATTNSGGFVGWFEGISSITNSYATGSVQGGTDTGGFCGDCLRTAIDCYATGNVSGTGNGVGGFGGYLGGIGGATRIYATGLVSGGADNVGGLFGGNNSSGTITDSFAIGNVTGVGDNVGGLIGYYVGTGGTVTGSYALGDVTTAGNNIGGFVGEVTDSTTTITESWAAGNVKAANTEAGGFVGLNNGIISDSFAMGDVQSTVGNIGGFAGNSSGTGALTRCYATGNVTALGGVQNAGGFVGYLVGTVTESYATGNVYADLQYVGGFAGSAYSGTSAITNSYATGHVQGNLGVGGFLGNATSSGSISENYSTGNVIGNNQVGGFVGGDSGTGGTLENNFVMNQMTSGFQDVGAFAGEITAGTVSSNYTIGDVSGNTTTNAFIGNYTGGTLAYNYWNSDYSNASNGTEGVASVTNQYEPLTTSQMQLASTFSGNWNYSTIWTQNNKNGYPHRKTSAEGRCTDNPSVSAYTTLGSGTVSDPYILCNRSQWEDLTTNGCSSGSSADCDKYFKLGADIDFSNSMLRIGTGSVPFTGVLDGNGHSLYNVYYSSGTPNTGVTANLAGVVKNLEGINVDMTGVVTNSIGFAAGEISGGQVLNVKARGRLQASSLVGGLVGQVNYSAARFVDAYVIHSEFVGNVISNTASGGGIIGGNIFDSASRSYVKGTSAYADVSVGSDTGGGIAGYFGGYIINSSSFGSVTGNGVIGGLTGQSYAADVSISKSYTTMDLNGGNGGLIGGIMASGSNVGRSTSVSDSYTSNATIAGGTASQVGGGSGARVSFQRSLVNNTLTGTGTNLGGFSGLSYGGNDNFWNSDNSLSNWAGDQVGASPGNYDEVTDATVDDDSVYTTAGWDTTNTWLLRNNLSPPTLRWSIHPYCQSNPTAVTYNALGAGTASNPYIICFPEQLSDLATNGCNIGTSTAGCGSSYVLYNSLDFKGLSMTPIAQGTNFSGTFYGKGNKIFNLSMNLGAASNVGLFESLSGAKIYNLEIIKSTIITTGSNGGLLAGSSINSSVYSVKGYGSVTASGGNAGGLLGGFQSAGGNGAYAENIQFQGTVTSSGDQVGGLIGLGSGTEVYLNRGFSAATVSGSGDVGGQVGLANLTILNSLSNSTVTGTGLDVGGFAGSGYGMIVNSGAKGSVSGDSFGTAGFVGSFYGAVYDSWSNVDVDSSAIGSGGFIGGGQATALIYRNYSTGTFSGSTQNGFYGTNFGTLTYNYYNETAAGNNTQNVGAQAEPLDLANFQIPGNFVTWDFTDTWKNVSGSFFMHRGGLLNSYSSSRRPRGLASGDGYVNTTSLEASWNMDESSGAIIDSVNSWSGSANGTPTYGSTGQVGDSVTFDGDDYFVVADPGSSNLDFAATDSITLSLWIYPTSLTGTQVLLSKGGTSATELINYSLNLQGDEILFRYRNSGDTAFVEYSTATENLALNQWQHITMVLTFGTAGSAVIYINGVPAASGAWSLGAGTESPYVSDEDLWIGAQDIPGGPTGDNLFSGRMDEVQIWRRELAIEEVKDLYHRSN